MTVGLLEAIGALNGTLQALLPGAAEPELAPELFINPRSSHLAGVGGVIGRRALAPAGEVMALRVTAEVVVRVKADNVASLAQRESDVSLALLGADPVNLRSSGVFRILRSKADSAGSDVLVGDADAGIVGRDVRFEVLYEFSKQPESAVGVITSVPVDLIQRSGVGAQGAPSDLIRLEFESDPMQQLEVVDDAPLSSPGQWSFATSDREVRQTSTGSGGSDAFDPEKRGTALLVRATATPPAARNFVLYTSVRSDGPGGIGLVFRYQDIDNFYYALLHESGALQYRILGRKLGGAFSALESGGADGSAGYTPNRWFSLRLALQDDQFDLAIDGVAVLSGRDAGISSAGRVGFFCRGSAGARFRFLHWAAL
jgi:hypothetical protein